MLRRNTDQFYTDLPLHKIPASQLVAKGEYFHKVPEDWHVIITDIQGSTQAVKDGLQQIVNLVASGSVIAVLNIGQASSIQIPFFFGGDGATLLVPPSILETSMQALVRHQENTARNFQLNLRVGQVPVLEVYQHDNELRLAKACLGKSFAIPVLLGNGLKFAEKVIKARLFAIPESAAEDAALNLEGMECRWDLVKPPKDKPEVVCLLVEINDPDQQAAIFTEVLEKIDAIYGSQEIRNPISIRSLKLKASLARVYDEMRTKMGRFNLTYLLQTFFYTFFGFVYFRFYASGKYYLRQLVDLSDTLVLDGRINTVISGTSQQRIALSKALEKMEKEKKLFFGLHVSQESVISCYVRNRKDEHLHFVDGSQGGYTQAAKMLKQKLGALRR